MNLEGSLSAFGLPDIVRLLSATSKSGVLWLRRDQARAGHAARRPGQGPRAVGTVWFAGGTVSGASPDAGRQPLARRLVGTGMVSDDALREAVALAMAGPLGPARALLEAGAVDPDVLREAASDQTLDAVAELVGWDDGTFEFAMGEENPDDVGIRLAVDGLLAEVSARDAAWAAVTAAIPSSDVVVCLPVALSADPHLTRDEWAVLALVDGRRTVEEVVELTGNSQFTVTSTLADLVHRGLVLVREPGAVDHVGEVQRRLDLLASLEGPGDGADDGDDADGYGGADARPGGGPGQARPAPAARSLSERAGERSGDRVGDAGSVEPAVRSEPARPTVPAYAGALAMAGSTAPVLHTMIERDPAVDRGLLLRLIAGVRGL